MAVRTLELFRRIVRQQTNLIGQVVENIYGAVPGAFSSLADTKASSWQKIVLPGNELRTLDEFYALWSVDAEKKHELLSALEGAVISTEPNACLQLFRSVASPKAPITLQLVVDAGATSSSIAIYVDGNLIRKASDALELPLAIGAGDHIIEVLTVAQHVVIGGPPTIQVVGDKELLIQPAFDSASSVWLDASTGTPGTQLVWNVDPHVGGYRLLRKEATFLGKIKNVSVADHSGIFGVTLSGDQSAAVNPGETLSALHEPMGTAITVGLYDSGSDETSFILRLVNGLTASKSGVNAGWVGRTALAGHYVELKRLRRTVGAGQMTLMDADVKVGDGYEYALQSYGLFDESILSKESAPVYVRAGDTAAPGPITFVAGYPKVINNQAWVRFTTPSDEDYDGVQVFYRREYAGVVSSATAGSITFNSSILTGVTMGTDTYEVVITSGPAQGAVKKVASLTANSVTLDANEHLGTLPVSGNTAIVYVDFSVVTDRGVAGSTDELTFDAKRFGDGLYFFRTFDFGNNLQLDADGATWTYNHAIDDNLSYSTCTAVMTSSSPSQVVITVTASATVNGTPQVMLASTPYNTTIVSGAAVGVLVASGSTWTFSRPAALSQPGSASFEAVLTGTVHDTDDVTIPEQGRDTVSLSSRAEVFATSASLVTVRYKVADAFPLGAGAYTVTYVQAGVGGVDLASPQTLGGAADGANRTVTADLSTTGFVQFVITRPAHGLGTGRVTFTVSAANRVADSDAVDVPEMSALGLGAQLLKNPMFLDGTTSYVVYDNAASGNVTLSVVSDNTSPNASGKFMRVTVAAMPAGAPTTNPGLGGIGTQLVPDTGIWVPGTYHRGGKILWLIRAKIPVGHSINFATNAYGTGGTQSWLTSQQGTGDWYDYRMVQQIGTTGTFSTTGYFYLLQGTNNTFYDGTVKTWDIAACMANDQNMALVDTNTVMPTLDVTPGVPTTAAQDFTITTLSNPAPGAPTAPTLTVTWNGVGTVTKNGVTSSSGVAAVQGDTFSVARPVADSLGNVVAGSIKFTASIAGQGTCVVERTIAPQARNTILPTLKPASGNSIASENGALGTVSFSMNDPQARATQYRTITTSGRSAPVDSGLLAVTSTMNANVTLVSKLASYIDVDWYGTDGAGNTNVLLGHQRFTFGLGNRPMTPSISWSVDDQGNLSVSVAIDNDTKSLRVKAQIGAPIGDLDTNPTVLDTNIPAGSLLRSFDNLLGATKLHNADRFFIAARAYNTTDGSSAATAGSDAASVSDIYAGAGSSYLPSTAVSSLGSTSSGISVRITPNIHCAEFEIYIKEFATDPGSFSAVDDVYPAPYDDVIVGSTLNGARVAPGGNYDTTFPIANGSNYLVITVLPYDSLAKVGPSNTIKVAGPGGGVTGPLPPTASSNLSHTSTSVTNRVTMPATVPSFIRCYQNNVAIGDVPTTGAVANTLFTLPAHTGLTPSTPYGFQYSSVTGGVESSTKTPTLTVTTDAPSSALPTPTLTDAYWENGYFYFTITPGVGTPTTGVHYHVETSSTSGGSYTEVAARGGDDQNSGHVYKSYPSAASASLVVFWWKVWCSATGYTNSAHTVAFEADRPAAGGPK